MIVIDGSHSDLIINEHVAKGDQMDINFNQEFSKKGILERIIEIAAKYLKRSIVSTPISYNPGNYLVTLAKKHGNAWLNKTLTQDLTRPMIVIFWNGINDKI
jgi:hypothetical protein